MKKALLVLSALCLVILPVRADDDGDADASYGLSANVDYKVAKGLHLSAEAETRMQDSFSNMERWTLGAGLDYRLCPWLKVDCGYLFLNRYKPSRLTSLGNTVNGYWSPRHRAFASLIGSVNTGRWTLQLRERYQYTYAPLQYVPKYSSDGTRMTDAVEEDTQEHLLRSRLQGKYNIRHCPFTPSASVEFLDDLVHGFHLDEIRYVVGGDYKLNKQQSLNLHCRYEQHFNDDDGIVILIGYNYSF